MNMPNYKKCKYVTIFLCIKQTPYINERDISLIIKSLEPTRAHECDNLRIKRIKIVSQWPNLCKLFLSSH